MKQERKSLILSIGFLIAVIGLGVGLNQAGYLTPFSDDSEQVVLDKNMTLDEGGSRFVKLQPSPEYTFNHTVSVDDDETVDFVLANNLTEAYKANASAVFLNSSEGNVTSYQSELSDIQSSNYYIVVDNSNRFENNTAGKAQTQLTVTRQLTQSSTEPSE